MCTMYIYSTEREELSLKCKALIEVHIYYAYYICKCISAILYWQYIYIPPSNHLQEKESINSEQDDLKALSEELGRELHLSKAQLGEQKTESEYLNTQLEVR